MTVISKWVHSKFYLRLSESAGGVSNRSFWEVCKELQDQRIPIGSFSATRNEYTHQPFLRIFAMLTRPSRLLSHLGSCPCLMIRNIGRVFHAQPRINLPLQGRLASYIYSTNSIWSSQMACTSSQIPCANGRRNPLILSFTWASPNAWAMAEIWESFKRCFWSHLLAPEGVGSPKKQNLDASNPVSRELAGGWSVSRRSRVNFLQPSLRWVTN